MRNRSCNFFAPAGSLLIFFSRRPGQFAAAAIVLHPFPEIKVVVGLPACLKERAILPHEPLDDVLQGLFPSNFGSHYQQHCLPWSHRPWVMLVVMDNFHAFFFDIWGASAP